MNCPMLYRQYMNYELSQLYYHTKAAKCYYGAVVKGVNIYSRFCNIGELFVLRNYY